MPRRSEAAAAYPANSMNVTLAPERERQVASRSSIVEQRLEALLQEAEDGGGYTEVTAQDWEDIERDGLKGRLVRDGQNRIQPPMNADQRR